MTTPLRKTRLFAHETASLDKVAADAGDLYYDKGLNTLRLFTKDTYTYGTAAAEILATRAWSAAQNLTGHIVTTNGTAAVLGSFTSAHLHGALTDETGTGLATFNTSPTMNTSLISGTSSFDLLNTTLTTINFGGAATTINFGGVNGHIDMGLADTITMGSGDNGSLVTINNAVEVQNHMYVELDTELNGLLNVGMGSEVFAATSGLKTYSITSASRTSDTVTLTTSITHTLVVGQLINVTMPLPHAYFVGDEVEVLTIGSNTLTYSLPGTNQPNAGTSATLTTVTGYTNLMAHFHIDADDYAQIAIHNMGNGIYSSTDIIAYASQGDDYSGYIDMGITNENFNDPSFTITGKNDGYIFMEAPQGTLGEGNLVLATGSRGTANKIVFAAGGLDSNSTQMEIIPDESVVIHIATESTSPTTGALVVDGGVGIFGNLNVQGATTIVGTLSFGGGTTTADNLAVADPLIFTGNANPADQLDLGIIGEYSIALSLSKVINNKALTSNVATLTTSTLHTLLAGDRVTVSGVDATFDGTVRVIDVPTTSTFTYSVTAEDVPTVAVSPTGTLAGVTRRKFEGMLRDASDGIIKFFNGATAKPSTTVNFGEAGLAYAPLQIGALTCTNGIASTSYTTGTLLVTGGVGVSGAMFVNGNLTSYGNVVAWYASDKRLKTNIVPISGAMDKISQIGGYSFDWNAEGRAQDPQAQLHEVGVIAQEIQAVLPEVVVERTNGYLAVNYEKIIPLLIQGMKELQAEITTLKAKLGE